MQTPPLCYICARSMQRIGSFILILLGVSVMFAQSAQSAKLRGRVSDASGSVMPGAQIKIYRADEVVKEAVTSATGDFDIAVDPGEFKIEIIAPGFETHTETVQAAADARPLAITMRVAQLQQAIEERRPQIEQLKAQRKALPKHIEIKDLPEQDRFHRLRSEKKHFIDTIKLIAYRAETALAQLARHLIPAGGKSASNPGCSSSFHLPSGRECVVARAGHLSG